MDDFRSNPFADIVSGMNSSHPEMIKILPVQKEDRLMDQPLTVFTVRLAAFIAIQHAEVESLIQRFNDCEDDEERSRIAHKLYTAELRRDSAIHVYYLDLQAYFPRWNELPVFTIRKDAEGNYVAVTTAKSRNWLRDNTTRVIDPDAEFKAWKYFRPLAIYELVENRKDG